MNRSDVEKRIALTKAYIAEIKGWDIPNQCTALSIILDSIATPHFPHSAIIEGLKEICDGKGFELSPRRLQ